MLKNIKDLNTCDKVGLVLWTVSVGLYMTYVVKEAKKENAEFNSLSKALSDRVQEIKDKDSLF